MANACYGPEFLRPLNIIVPFVCLKEWSIKSFLFIIAIASLQIERSDSSPVGDIITG